MALRQGGEMRMTRVLRAEGTVPHRVVARGVWWSADDATVPCFWAIGATREEALGRLLELATESLKARRGSGRP
jgi:hypothetical protein